jgi:4'-phosphopantetheinyl transferase
MSATPPALPATPCGAREPWALGPAEPRLERGALHLWRADLRAVDDALRGLLSSDERARAARFARELDGVLWGRSRGVLRTLLGRYLRADPAALALASARYGKPRLDRGPSPHVDASKGDSAGRPPKLHFNLSHSRHLALYAFSATAPVGVDVQIAREGAAARRTDRVALAARTFGALQARQLEALEPKLREQEFLRLWTRYEAELKRRGTGIAGAGEDPAASQAADASCDLYELDVGPGAAAAVAVERPIGDLRCWGWA